MTEATNSGSAGANAQRQETPGRHGPQAHGLQQAAGSPQGLPASGFSPKFPDSPSGGRTPSDGGLGGDQFPRELVLRVMPMPADVNANGDVFGGWIMAQVDLAASVLPTRLSRGRVTTVAVNQFVFKQPVSIGDLLSFYAQIQRVGRTSMTVNVEVFAERDPVNPHVVKVTEASLTYVAIDHEGKPRVIELDKAGP